MTQLSFPVSKRPFSVSDWRYVIGNEPAIKEDVNGTSYDLTFSTNSDFAYLGSATQDSISTVGGGGHVIPAGTTQGIEVPPATNQPRTDLLVVRYDPEWAVLPSDEALHAAHIGPCRVHRVAGTEGAGVPTFDGTAIGVEDLVHWEVTRTPNQALSQATRRDRRVRQGPNLFGSPALNLADLGTNVPLGSRATVKGVHYVRVLDGQGFPVWVQQLPASPVSTTLPTVEGYATLDGHGAARYEVSHDGWVDLSGAIGRTAPAAVGVAAFAVANLPPGARPVVARTFPVVTSLGAARVSIATAGNVTVIYPSAVTVPTGWWVAFDSLRFRIQQ